MKKFLKWAKTAGLRSLGYLGGAAVLFTFGWTHLATAAFTVFVVDNFVTIKALIKKGIDELENLA